MGGVKIEIIFHCDIIPLPAVVVLLHIVYVYNKMSEWLFSHQMRCSKHRSGIGLQDILECTGSLDSFVVLSSLGSAGGVGFSYLHLSLCDPNLQ